MSFTRSCSGELGVGVGGRAPHNGRRQVEARVGKRGAGPSEVAVRIVCVGRIHRTDTLATASALARSWYTPTSDL